MSSEERDPAEVANRTPLDRAPDGLELAQELARAALAHPGAVVAKRRGSRSGAGGPGGSGAAGSRRRGGRSRSSGAYPDDRDPQTLDATLGRLVAARGWSTDLQVHGAIARWAEVVGPEIAEHSTPEAYDEGRLRVRTDTTAWATQLRLLAPSILVKLNARLGEGTVTLLDVQPPQAPSWTRGRRTVRGRGPRDTYG